MPSFVGWDEPTGNKNKGGGQFLKLEAGKTYHVRLVSNAVRYFQHWEPVICRSPGIDPKTNKILDPLMQQNYAPKERYAIWVIDRDDANRLKVMDFPPVLFEQFAEWKVNFNEAPGGPNGPNWKIKLEMRGNNRRLTQYKASHLDKAPFTAEELEQIKAGNLKEKLAELRKENTPEEIRQLLAAKGGDPTGPASAKPQATTAAAAAPAEAPTETFKQPEAAPAEAPKPKGFEF